MAGGPTGSAAGSTKEGRTAIQGGGGQRPRACRGWGGGRGRAPRGGSNPWSRGGGCLPVQGVVLHSQIISGEVAGRVAEVVVLVPEDSLAPWGGGNDLHLDRELHR